jgi:hypothetical protein
MIDLKEKAQNNVVKALHGHNLRKDESWMKGIFVVVGGRLPSSSCPIYASSGHEMVCGCLLLALSLYSILAMYRY